MARERVTVVIPSWNGRALLEGALASIAAQTEPVRTIVVDNGSADGTVEWLADRPVDVVALPSNSGFAPAVNRGVEAAATEYVALVNNDVELAPDWAARMADALDAAPAAGSAACKMLGFHDRGLIDATGDTWRWRGSALQRGQGEVDRGQYDRAGVVFSACAGAALYRASALRAVGPFDEAFFAYVEDVDWGFRAQLLGWTCVYEPRAVCFHIGSASSPSRSPFVYALPRRNVVWTVLKNYPAEALVRHAPALLLEQAVSLGVSVRDGMALPHLRALAQAAAGLPRVLRQRRALQRARVVGVAELDALITGDRPPRRPLREALRPAR